MPAFRVWSIAVAILFVLPLPEAAHGQGAHRAERVAKYKAVSHAEFRTKRVAKQKAVSHTGFRAKRVAKYKAVPHAKFRAKRAVKYGALRRARIRRGYLGLGFPIVAGIYVPPGTVLPPYWIFPRPYARWNFYRHTGWQQRIGLWSSHLKPGKLRSDDEFYKPVPGIKTRLRPSKLVTRNQWLSPTNWSKPKPW